MLNDVAKKWVAALRSGEYMQGQGVLRSQDDRYCCLGVLCDLAVKEGVISEPILNRRGYIYAGSYAIFLPNIVTIWAKLSSNIASFRSNSKNSLTRLNDEGASFSTIADLIESELEGLFCETKRGTATGC